MLKSIRCPLPFIGNKSRFLKNIIDNKDKFKIDDETIIIDVFGGSGVLSKTFKYLYPNNTVIYNDYDDFHELFNKEFENKINGWLNDIRKITSLHKDKKDKLNKEECQAIRDLIIKHFGEIDKIDFKILRIIMSNIEFQGLNTNMKKMRSNFYNRVRKTNYSIDEHYYDDLVVEKLDYIELLKKYIKNDNIFLIMDPPYLSTNPQYYGHDNYFNLKDLINILNLLKKYNCLFFEGSKSDIQGLFEILKNENVINYELMTQKQQLNNKKKIIESMWLFKPIISK